MKNSTYKWIIGCLLGVIIVLITYLVLRENNMISVSFSECLSVASTISSLILSVIAMLYTYYSGRDTGNISAQIQNTIKAVDRQVQKVSEDTRKNSETLAKIIEGTQTILNAVNSSSEAFQTIQEEHVSEQERQNAMETIEKSKNSMLMFLKKMQEKFRKNIFLTFLLSTMQEQKLEVIKIRLVSLKEYALAKIVEQKFLMKLFSAVHVEQR